jgi:hypothetical protein
MFLLLQASVIASTDSMSREKRLCSPTSGFVSFTKANEATARQKLLANLQLARYEHAAHYVSRILLRDNTASIWLTASGESYVALGNSTLTSEPMRGPLAVAIDEAWMNAYISAYALSPADACDWLILYSPHGKQLYRQRDFIEAGP